jgi:serine/threonine-protein phosphatase 5
LQLSLCLHVVAHRWPYTQLGLSGAELFKELPLGAVIASATLVVHGGIWRKTTITAQGKRKRGKKRCVAPTWPPDAAYQAGTLSELRSRSKGGMNPLGMYADDVLQSQALWSDPVMEPGVHENYGRGGIGLVFGPDATEAFLTANGLRLVIRSHEGPDARLGRDDMPSMHEGFSLDHDTPAGVPLDGLSHAA